MKIIIGIKKEIFWETNSELNIKKRRTGIVMALNDNNVGRKLQGPKSIFPFKRK